VEHGSLAMSVSFWFLNRVSYMEVFKKTVLYKIWVSLIKDATFFGGQTYMEG
jgi:hypothetical protein